MSVFDARDFDDHEEVHFLSDPASGLRAIIAMHRKLPSIPSGGGIRMWPYPSEDAGLADVLRLSRAMTFKLALAGVRIGSAKSVIFGDPQKNKTDSLLLAFGRAVESFGGRYFCAEDVGISSNDLAVIRRETAHVVGLPGQDPSPGTAHGIVVCMRAAAMHRLGSESLSGLKIAVQGLGDVGYNLCRLLHKEGAQLYVSDIVQSRVARAAAEFGAVEVDPGEILYLGVDILSPCALGEVINAQTIDRLHASVICGGANNILSESALGETLASRRILFVPDYLSNSGGVISVAGTRTGEESSQTHAKIENLYATCLRLFTKADDERMSTSVALNRLTESLIEAIYGKRASSHLNTAKSI